MLERGGCLVFQWQLSFILLHTKIKFLKLLPCNGDKWKNRNSDLLFSAHMEFGICEHQQVVSVLQVCKFILENSDSWRNWKSPDFSGQLFIRSGNSTGNLWEITSAPVSVLSPSTYPTKENLIGLYIGCETSSYWW